MPPAFQALPGSLKMVRFPSWPGFVPAMTSFTMKLFASDSETPASAHAAALQRMRS
jgi:hypothetical protein